MLLGDNKGNKVEGMLYREDIELLKNSLHQHQTYLISNAVVRPVKPRFENPLANNKFQWIIGARTAILAPAQDSFISSELDPIFIQYDKFRDFIGSRKFISTAAIIIDSHTPRTVSSKGRQNTLHEYAAVEELLKPFIITFWNDAPLDTVYNLLDSTKDGHVIAALNFSVSDYHNISLSSTSASIIFMNSKFDRIQELQKWGVFKKGDIFKKAQNHFNIDPGTIISFQALLSNEQPERSNLCVRGKLARRNQHFIYPCCDKCHRLTTAEVWFPLRVPFLSQKHACHSKDGTTTLSHTMQTLECQQLSSPAVPNSEAVASSSADVIKISTPQKTETKTLPSTSKEHPHPEIHTNTSSRGRTLKAKKVE